MAIVVSDSFTGSTGAAWSSSWTQSKSTGASTATIDANRGKHVTSASGSYADSRADRLTWGTTVDAIITGTINFPADTEAFAQVHFRQTTTNFTNGYFFSIEPSYNTIRFYKRVSGTQSGLGTATTFTLNASTTYSWKVEATGTTLRAKVWTGSEPGSWTVSITDSSHTAAGYVGLEFDGGSAAAARTCYWDAITLDVPTSAVGKNLDTRWSVRSVAGNTVDARWGTRAPVGKSLDARWGIRSTAGKNTDARWTVRGATAMPLDVQWSARTPILSLIHISEPTRPY